MKTRQSLSLKTTMEVHSDWQRQDRLPIYRKFFLPSLLNKNPITIPMTTTVIDEEVNKKIVFGSFSIINSLTLLEPSLVVKNLELPRFNVMI